MIHWLTRIMWTIKTFFKNKIFGEPEICEQLFWTSFKYLFFMVRHNFEICWKIEWFFHFWNVSGTIRSSVLRGLRQNGHGRFGAGLLENLYCIILRFEVEIVVYMNITSNKCLPLKLKKYTQKIKLSMYNLGQTNPIFQWIIIQIIILFLECTMKCTQGQIKPKEILFSNRKRIVIFILRFEHFWR